MDSNDDDDAESNNHLRSSKFKDYLPIHNVSEKFISRSEAIKVFQKFDWNMGMLTDHVYLDCEIPSPDKDVNYLNHHILSHLQK